MDFSGLKMRNKWRFRVGGIKVWVSVIEKGLNIFISTPNGNVRFGFKCIEDYVFFLDQFYEIAGEYNKIINKDETYFLISNLLNRMKGGK